MIEVLSSYWLFGVLLLFAGVAAGFAGGMFGIGGGIIMVPVLYAVFQNIGLEVSTGYKTAVGTSLAVIIITSVRSLMTHHKAGHVDIALLRAWLPWIALGAAVGGVTAKWAPVEALTLIFIGGAFFIAYRRLRAAPPKKQETTIDLHRKRYKLPFGFGAGLFSSLMGLGGGAVGVMVMSLAGRAMHQSIATASGFGVGVAVPGALGFVLAGWGVIGLAPGSLGFVSLPAFFIMSITAVIAAPIGARMAHRTSSTILSRLFGIYVLIAAIFLCMDIFR